MKSLFILFILIATTVFIGCNDQKLEKVNKYTVVVDANNLRKLHVEAEINLEGNILSMDWISANFLEKGWAQFVEDLKVYDLKGKPIQFNYKDKATWVLNTDKKRVKVTYDVNLTHDKILWEEGGHSAASYVLEDVVYSIGAAIFIANPVEELVNGAGAQTLVHFNMPESYDIAVPWKRLEGKPQLFSVNSTYELVRSGLSYGNIEKSVFKISNTQVEIATAQDFKEIIPLYKEIYNQVIPALSDYFGGGTDNKYVVISNMAPRTEEFDPYFSGEGLYRSMSFITPFYPPNEYISVFWYILTHEYAHNWLGINIQPTHQHTEYWFMEGFTDYISWGIIHLLGQIPNDLMLNGFLVGDQPLGWGENIKKYLSVVGKVNMREAGEAKKDNYGLLYSGGSVFAMTLDIEMNVVSGGKVGLKDLIRKLNQEFGMNSQKTLDFSDIKNAVNKLVGKNLDYLFDKYVNGKEIIPVDKYLQKAGIICKNLGKEDQALVLDENATAKQKKLLKAITGIE